MKLLSSFFSHVSAHIVTGLLISVIVSQASHAQVSPAIQSAKGKFAVGLRVIEQYDKSRVFLPAKDTSSGKPYTGERARPIQTLMWYPTSANSSNNVVHYRDYIRTRYSETKFAQPEAELARAMSAYEATLQRRLGVGAQALLNSRTNAHLDAPVFPGRFPLVIYAPGAGGSADENAEMFEYLASHGYVVLSSTSMAATGKEIGDGMEAVEPQIADILFLLNYANSLANVDISKVAILGWSWGGMANVFAAARDQRIGAIISLDGTREPELTRTIDINKLKAPWLYVSRSPDTISQINRSGIDTSFSLLNEAKFTDVYQLIAYPMQHVDFTSMRLHESSPGSYREYQRDELVQAYSVITEYVRHFLAATLQHDKEAKAFLQRPPKENGAAPHSMRMDMSLAQAKETK